mmetsp:Transcript_34295/g.86059  ORF Transcript_34295/g.86059 Transcript_34295/m.86059 type:complete len:258 (-) Transcript_34295:298-1071(-)
MCAHGAVPLISILHAVHLIELYIGVAGGGSIVEAVVEHSAGERVVEGMHAVVPGGGRTLLPRVCVLAHVQRLSGHVRWPRLGRSRALLSFPVTAEGVQFAWRAKDGSALARIVERLVRSLALDPARTTESGADSPEHGRAAQRQNASAAEDALPTGHLACEETIGEWHAAVHLLATSNVNVLAPIETVVRRHRLLCHLQYGVLVHVANTHHRAPRTAVQNVIYTIGTVRCCCHHHGLLEAVVVERSQQLAFRTASSA